MLFEIALDYVAHHEFENLILFNNNILETRQHGTERVTRYGGTKAGSGSPSASGTREALTILALPRGGSSSPQCLRLGLVCTSVRPTASPLDGPCLTSRRDGSHRATCSRSLSYNTPPCQCACFPPPRAQ